MTVPMPMRVPWLLVPNMPPGRARHVALGQSQRVQMPVPATMRMRMHPATVTVAQLLDMDTFHHHPSLRSQPADHRKKRTQLDIGATRVIAGADRNQYTATLEGSRILTDAGDVVLPENPSSTAPGARSIS